MILAFGMYQNCPHLCLCHSPPNAVSSWLTHHKLALRHILEPNALPRNVQLYPYP